MESDAESFEVEEIRDKRSGKRGQSIGGKAYHSVTLGLRLKDIRVWHFAM